MHNIGKTLLVTTTRYELRDTLRAQLARETFLAAREERCVVIIVDDSRHSSYADAFRQSGAIVFRQHQAGMAASRRQAFFHAHEFVLDYPRYDRVMWLEPEKRFLPKLAATIAAPIDGVRTLVSMACRSQRSWATWPDFQVASEQKANAVYAEATGWEGLDPMFGTVAFHVSLLPELMTFHARRFAPDIDGDYVQVLASLVLCAQRRQRPARVEVGVEYPPEQRQEEEGMLRDIMVSKRRFQCESLSKAFRALGQAFALPRIIPSMEERYRRPAA
ncbi:MAG: hypothetical protein V4467_01445 [Patescibacteria group bacterium]